MTTMKLRALAMVTMAAALTVFTSSQSFATTTVPTTATALPGVDLSATPAGWVPVIFGNAQVSVPATWWVLYNSPPCPTGSPPGEVFVNPPPGVFPCPVETAPGPSTTVRFGPPTSPHSNVLGHPEVINGILVYPYPTGPQSSYLVPSLGVEITVAGPLGQRVLHTLTWSPRSVLLEPGSSPAIPSSWQQVTFAGLRFSAPANWPVNRTQVTPGLGAICGEQGVAFAGTTVTLSTDAASCSPCLLPSHGTDSAAAGERSPGRFGVTHRADCDALPFGSLPRPPRFDGVPGNFARLLHHHSQGKRARARQAGLLLHRLGRERQSRQDHPGLVAGSVMRTLRNPVAKLDAGFLAVIGIGVRLVTTPQGSNM